MRLFDLRMYSSLRSNGRNPLFEESTVHQDGKDFTLDKSYRSSWTAYLTDTSHGTKVDQLVLRCIEERASTFQGYIPISNIEQLQLTRFLLLTPLLMVDIQSPNNIANIMIGLILKKKLQRDKEIG
jgi:hypothetical protein